MTSNVTLANAQVPGTIWTGAQAQTFTEFMKSHLTVSLMDFIPAAEKAAIGSVLTERLKAFAARGGC